VSPKAFQRLVLERLHFHGNRHEFFASTKFAGCLREDEHDELFALCTWRTVAVGETVFEKGESTASGLIMVVDGALGVYGKYDQDTFEPTPSFSLPKSSSTDTLSGAAGSSSALGRGGSFSGLRWGMDNMEENAGGGDGEARAGELLHYELAAGESIGDLDLLYASEQRRFTVRAIKASTVLELSQDKFRKFCVENPDALLLFLRLAVGRLHRVSSFVISEFLNLNVEGSKHDLVVLKKEGTGHESTACNALISRLFEGNGVFKSSVEERSPGDVIFVKGDTPKAFWVVLDGEIELMGGSDHGKDGKSATGKSSDDLDAVFKVIECVYLSLSLSLSLSHVALFRCRMCCLCCDVQDETLCWCCFPFFLAPATRFLSFFFLSPSFPPSPPNSHAHKYAPVGILLKSSLSCSLLCCLLTCTCVCCVPQGPYIMGSRQFLTAVERKETAVVKSTCRIARFDIEFLMKLSAKCPSEVVDLILLAAQSLFPTIKQVCRPRYSCDFNTY